MLFTLQVEKLVLIGASVYAEGTGNLSRLARPLASAAVSLCFYARKNVAEIILAVALKRSVHQKIIC